MEVWDVVALVLGSNLLIAFATVFTTQMQQKNSTERFKIELGRAIDVENRKRKWEVRSEPLIKLRSKLADIATTLHLLILADRGQEDKAFSQQGESEVQSLFSTWRNYGTSEDFLRIVYLQYDSELLQLVDNIQSGFLLAHTYSLHFSSLRDDERKTLRDQLQETSTKIHKVQELINKKLEEL